MLNSILKKILFFLIIQVFIVNTYALMDNTPQDIINLQPDLFENLEFAFKRIKCEMVYHADHPSPKKGKYRTILLQLLNGELKLQFADLNNKPYKDMEIITRYTKKDYQENWINDGKGLVLDLVEISSEVTSVIKTNAYGIASIPFNFIISNTYSEWIINVSFANNEPDYEINSYQDISRITVVDNDGKISILENLSFPISVYVRKKSTAEKALPVKQPEIKQPAIEPAKPAVEQVTKQPVIEPKEKPVESAEVESVQIEKIAEKPAIPKIEIKKPPIPVNKVEQKIEKIVKPALKIHKTEPKKIVKTGQEKDRLIQKKILSQKKQPIFNGYIILTLTREWVKNAKEVNIEYAQDWFVKFNISMIYFGKNKVFIPKISLAVPWPDETYQLTSLSEKQYMYDSQASKYEKICGGPMVNLDKTDSVYPWAGPYELIIKYTTGDPQKVDNNGNPVSWQTEPYIDTITIPFYTN